MPFSRSLVVLATAAVLLPIGSGQAAATTTPPDCPPRAGAPAPVREALPPSAAAFMAAYRAWGAAPTVCAYMDLFTPDGTLMDTGLAAPIGHEAIRKQIERVLTVVPDYRFDPFSATASPDGRVVFVKARNTGTVTVDGRATKVDYLTTHRLVLRGDRVERGHRFWDQTELFRPLDPGLRDLFAGIGGTATAAEEPASGTASRPGDGIRERQRAWNDRDTDALVATVGERVRLTGPGLTAPLKGRTAARAYLDRFFGELHGAELAPGHTVRRGPTTYREWSGTAVVGPERRRVTYGIVERLTRDRSGVTDWDLSFDTLDLVATEQQISTLRARLFG
ncbi:nuclear transport factor 2 family protein [Streptomyces sp. NPDC020965]|uniref:nuclear transport factor 2 family protein n=1 Tax=Streptomyces sp. NPDC020965 TaxID=3365105 RepID=UPI00378F8A41